MAKSMLVVLAAMLAVAAAIPMNFVPPKVAKGKNWAVLVAGSNTWGNYRHQADVCHSYQVLKSHGFQDANIIVMMFDDIAANTQNPTKGVIINKPNGPDVYKGVPKDYTGADVTPANFLKVLKGQKAEMKGTGSGKVLESGPDDNVFIFFSDHGGPQIIAFPSDLLQASDLNDALKYMNTNKMYNQLVFYLEACESGSMFDGLLPNNINIYATTASDPTSSSYACYYDSKRQTYLGDVYSVNWMENSDIANFKTETLLQQFNIVKKETNTSTVEQYGQLSLNTQTLDKFQAGPNATTKAVHVRGPHPGADAVDSRDVKIAILRNRIRDAATATERAAIVAELDAVLNEYAKIDAVYSNIIARVAGKQQISKFMSTKLRVTTPNFGCLRAATETFHDTCFSYSQYEYALKHATALASMCESGFSADAVVEAINWACSSENFGKKLF